MMDDSELDNLADDDCDEINDETFGDFAEYNWEESNALLQEFKKPEVGPKQGSSDSWQNDVQEKATDNKNQMWDDDDAFDFEMEATISRLVMDEDDDDYEFNPSAPKFGSAGTTRVPYITPPQVQDRNLWFDDKDLQGYLGSSVWSSPSAAPTTGIRPSTAHSNSVPLSEHNLNSQHGREKSHPGLSSASRVPAERLDGVTIPEKPRCLTLDEIEKEIFAASAKKSEEKPRAIKLEDLEREMLHSTHQITQPMNGQNIAMFRVPHHLPPPQWGNFPDPRKLAQFRLPFQQGHPSFMPYPRLRGSPNEYVRNNRFPMPREGGFNRFEHPPDMHMHPFARPPMERNWPQGHNVAPHYRVRRPFEHYANSFTGFMNEKDKQRLRNIQIIQLQNDHPHRTDYYFQMHTIRKEPNNKNAHLKSLNKLFPAPAEVLPKSDYQPARFENSLGKIQVVSAVAPKKVFELVENFDDMKAHASICGNARQTLCLIEKCYKHLQIIENMTIRLEILNSEMENDKIVREASLAQVKRLLDRHMESFINYKKGRMLIFQTLPRFESDIRTELLISVLNLWDSWIRNCEKQESWIIMKVIQNVFLTSTYDNCITYMQNLNSRSLSQMRDKQLGCTIIHALLHTLELHKVPLDVIRNQNDENVKSKTWKSVWSDFNNWRVVPFTLFPRFADHLYRLGIEIPNEVKEEYHGLMANGILRVARAPEPAEIFGLLNFDQTP